jgi:hypothetical protein
MIGVATSRRLDKGSIAQRATNLGAAKLDGPSTGSVCIDRTNFIDWVFRFRGH